MYFLLFRLLGLLLGCVKCALISKLVPPPVQLPSVTGGGRRELRTSEQQQL